jgi:hypothetical protein
VVKSRKSLQKQPPQQPLPRGPVRFREREFARAVRAAKRAGGERVELDPATGKICVVLGGRPDEPGNDLDNWLKKKDAHQA